MNSFIPFSASSRGKTCNQRIVGAELGRKDQPFAIFGESHHHDRLGAGFHCAYDARESLGAGAEDDDALQELHLPFGPDQRMPFPMTLAKWAASGATSGLTLWTLEPQETKRCRPYPIS